MEIADDDGDTGYNEHDSNAQMNATIVYIGDDGIDLLLELGAIAPGTKTRRPKESGRFRLTTTGPKEADGEPRLSRRTPPLRIHHSSTIG